MYRGHLHTVQTLGGEPPARKPEPKATLKRQAVPALCVLSWNAGGYTPQVQNELFVWLEKQPHSKRPQIICLQKSHWNHCVQFRKAGYYHIADSTPSKGSGLITLISEDLCRPDNVHFRFLVDGRLLHVRLLLGRDTVDVINFYQAIWQTQHAQTCQQQRHLNWTALEALLSSLPARTQFVLDFNTGLRTSLQFLATHSFPQPIAQSGISADFGSWPAPTSFAL